MVISFVTIRRMLSAIVVLTTSILIGQCLGLENGLARTPPMGWMHWERYRCIVDCDLYPDECISEKLFKKTADLMVSDGYRDAGYEYVMIDDCWMSFERDPETQRLQPNSTRFPSGIKALADYVHSKGLKLGIYEDVGTTTCGGYPGSLGYEKIDAETFAEWEIDYLKYDGCYIDFDQMLERFSLMSKSLIETGRPIGYSCVWPAYLEPKLIKPNYTAVSEVCNLWRNWFDIDDSWVSVTNIMEWIIENQDRFTSHAGPGHWNDPDMLILGNFGLSYEQSKAQLTVWSILAAPFIISTDLANIKPEIRELILNKDVININQDSLGIQGKFVQRVENITVWTRPINPVVDNKNSFAIGFVSGRSDGTPYKISIKANTLGLDNEDGYLVEDIFDGIQRPVIKPDDDIVVRVKPSGGVLLRAVPRKSG